MQIAATLTHAHMYMACRTRSKHADTVSVRDGITFLYKIYRTHHAGSVVNLMTRVTAA